MSVSTTISAPTPPAADRRPVERDFSGVIIGDDYAWLEEPHDPDVVAYLEAENAYLEQVLAATGDLRERLHQELMARVQRTDVRVPVRIGDVAYYIRTEAGRDYDLLCRRVGGPEAPEQILLDLNEMAGEHLRLGSWQPSPDHRYLAYALNETGGIAFTLAILDMETGETLPERIPAASWGMTWVDNERLVYTVQDAALRSCAVRLHRVGTSAAEDQELYREADEIFSLMVSPSADRAYLFLTSGSMDSSDVRYVPLATPEAPLTLFAPRRPGVLYSLEHWDGEFLVLTNEDARDFQLLAVPVDPARRDAVRTVIPPQAGRLLQEIGLFRTGALVTGRQDGGSRLWLLDPATGAMRGVDFDEAVYEVAEGDNRDFDATSAVIWYESLVTPPTAYALDLVRGQRTLLKQEEVVGGHDPASYVSLRTFATAMDGARVPVSLVRRKDVPAGPRPLLLVGYGAYGHSFDPGFNRNALSLLDRGVTLAIAHVRGGQDLGRAWYEDGKLLRKQNTFTDFIACAEHLIALGETSPEQLAAMGGSAGGLLMGAVVNARPDLFRAVVAEVPFVDVVRVMLDPSLPLTTGEFVEWGDPRDPEYFAYLRGYSPYENTRAQAYPWLLLTAGLGDDQVPYWQPAKWAARLRALKTDSNPLLLYTNLQAGHSGHSGFTAAMRETSLVYAFLIQALGVADRVS
ncbi:MAG: S9 family peptidase [Thermomicrobiales bacterium]|nr:S9 family peptidase [Thermomicrobiales bacterium]